MFHYHILDASKAQHADFLSQNRFDPITGEEIREGDSVVICAACQSAFLEESWNYLRQQHCNQYSTLNQLPASKKIDFNSESFEKLAFSVRQTELFGREMIYRFFQTSTNIALSLVPFMAYVSFLVVAYKFRRDYFSWAMALGFFALIYIYFMLSSMLKKDTILAQMMKDKNALFVLIFLQNYSSKNHFTIDFENKTITSKTELGKNEIQWENIREFRYGYYADEFLTKADYFFFRIRITTHRGVAHDYLSIINRRDFPKFQPFLERLPKNFRILNRTNV